MITYDRVKKWWKEKENKDKVAYGASFVLIFFVGFGAGRFERETRRDVYKPQTNYSTAQNKKPLTETAAPAVTAEKGTALVASSSPVSTCIIKGNISTTGRKVYHVKGGAFYDRTKAEQCFNTEQEAMVAGFTKSQR